MSARGTKCFTNFLTWTVVDIKKKNNNIGTKKPKIYQVYKINNNSDIDRLCRISVYQYNIVHNNVI